MRTRYTSTKIRASLIVVTSKHRQYIFVGFQKFCVLYNRDLVSGSFQTFHCFVGSVFWAFHCFEQFIFFLGFTVSDFWTLISSIQITVIATLFQARGFGLHFGIGHFHFILKYITFIFYNIH
jgi:hypothetical protein